jgi:hypothetical protein
MNSFFDNPELMQQTLERQGFFSLPPEMQPAALAQLMQQLAPQPRQEQPQNLLQQITNAAKAFNPMPGRRAQTPTMHGVSTYGVRG